MTTPTTPITPNTPVKPGKPLRVTFVLPVAGMEGGVRVVAIYAERLRRRGHHVQVVSVTPPAPPLRRRIKSLLLGRGWPAAPSVGPSHLDAVPEIEHRILRHSGPVTDRDVPDADVVISTWWETAVWANRLSPRKGRPIHLVQDYEVWAGNGDRVDAALRLPGWKVAVSAWLERLLRDDLGVPTAVLAPNGVETDKFDAPPRRRRADPAVGLTFSSLHHKGADVALAAFDIARRRIPGLKLRVVSNFPPAPHLPFPEGAEFHRHARDGVLRDIYSSCDAWMFATRREGFGLPVLESMACRTPVVATPAGAVPEILADGGGVMVPFDDPPAMADALERLLTGPEPAWRELSDAARANALRRNWDAATDILEATLLRAAAEPDPRSAPVAAITAAAADRRVRPAVLRPVASAAGN
jgi:glycosyltransferase involved in cell wall biosynthesis